VIVKYNPSATPPWIIQSQIATTAWAVSIDNSQPGAEEVDYKAYAYCAS
jgi:hypothetical protein